MVLAGSILREGMGKDLEPKKRKRKVSKPDDASLKKN
jgi:hypothetical protein